jgi:PKD domain-containing protein
MKLARLLAVMTFALTFANVPGRADAPALFQVGVSVQDITPCPDPSCAQYLGGFGYGDPVDGSFAHDPMQVRAMAIASGRTMVLFAIVDTQGYFSGYQEGKFGSRDARIDAAKTIGGLGYDITSGNIIVSSTHSHAAPTIMGIWGTTDPKYLKQVHDGTVAALVDAASHLRPANLYTANGDIGTVTISNLTQTDGYQGWRPDGETPVLWARDPETDATIGLYANVPTHADIVNGVGHHVISADHIGVERDLLDADLGGTSVVAMGTLGRQETIVQVGGLDQASNVGHYVTNEIERALAHARPITDPTLIAAERYLLVPATNPALLALNAGNMAADPAGKATGDPIGTHCVPGVDICTIDRSILPPYAAGSAFGAWFTAFRIGDIVYATEPGEAFPEVSTAIRKVFGPPESGGPAAVRIVGMAQDQLGYYYPPETVPWTVINDSDHHIYNASLLLGEFNVYAHALNAITLGFTPAPNHETNQLDDPGALRRVGVQFFPIPREQTGTTFVFDTKWSESVLGHLSKGVLGPDAKPTSIDWDWGDGKTETTNHDGVISHIFPGPGAYTVTASVLGPTGPSHWTQTVFVDPPLSAFVTESGSALAVSSTGGAGSILAAHWTFDDSSTADGFAVTRPATATGGSVTVVDAAGNRAAVTF